MPRFSDHGPTDNDLPKLPLKRVPPTGKLVGIITSTKMTCCPTHWYNGRTTPCGQPDHCDPCSLGKAYEWKAYFSLWTPRTNEHQIVELTNNASKPIEERWNALRSIRGLAIEMWRPSGKACGRIHVNFVTKDVQGLAIPEEPQVQLILLNIWGYNADGTPTTKRSNHDAKHTSQLQAQAQEAIENNRLAAARAATEQQQLTGNTAETTTADAANASANLAEQLAHPRGNGKPKPS